MAMNSSVAIRLGVQIDADRAKRDLEALSDNVNRLGDVRVDGAKKALEDLSSGAGKASAAFNGLSATQKAAYQQREDDARQIAVLTRAFKTFEGAVDALDTQVAHGHRTMSDAARLQGALAEAYGRSTRAARELTAANQNVAGAQESAAINTRKLNAFVQQAGWQASDAANQLATGANAFTVFGMQAGQLLGSLGPVGAAIGAIVNIGGVMIGMMDKAASGADAYAKTQKALSQTIGESADSVEALAGKYSSLTDEMRALEQVAVSSAIRMIDEETKKLNKVVSDKVSTLSDMIETYKQISTVNQGISQAGGLDDLTGGTKQAQDMAKAWQGVGAVIREFGQSGDITKLTVDLDNVAKNSGTASGEIRKVVNALIADAKAAAEAGDQKRALTAQSLALSGQAIVTADALLRVAGSADSVATSMRKVRQAQAEAGASLFTTERDLDREIAALKKGATGIEEWNREKAKQAAYSKAYDDSIRSGLGPLDAQSEATRIAAKAVEAYNLQLKSRELTKADNKAESQAQRDAKAYAAVTAELDRDIAAQKRLMDATGQGVAALRQANVETKTAEALAKAKTTADTAEGKAIAAKVEEVEKYKNALADANFLNAPKQQMAYAEQELALMGQAKPYRERALRSFQIQQQAQELLKTQTKENVAEWVRYQEAIADTQAITAFRQEIEATAREFSRDVTEALLNGDLRDVGKQMGKRLLAGLLETQFVLPIMMQVVGSVPGLFGIQGPATGAAAGSAGAGSGVVGQLGNMGMNYAGSSLLGAATIDGLGASLGFAPGASFVGPMQPGVTATGSAFGSTTLSGALGAAGFGFGIGSLAGMLGLNKFKSAAVGGIGGGVAGGALAGTAIMPGIGTVAGAAIGAIAGIIGGLLSGKLKPSDKTGTSTIDLDDYGLTEGGLSGKKFSQENRDAATTLATSLVPIITSLERISGTDIAGGALTVGVGSRDGIYVQQGDERLAEFETSEEGTAQLIQFVTNTFAKGVQEKLPAGFSEALGKIDWSSAEEGLTDLAFLVNLEDGKTALDDLAGGLETIKRQAKETALEGFAPLTEGMARAKRLGAEADYASLITDQIQEIMNPTTVEPLAASLAQVDGNFDALRQTVETLGLAIEETEINTAQLAARERVLAGYRATYDADLYSAQGRDYLTGLTGVRTRFETNSASDIAAGRDPVALFNAQAVSILGGLNDSQLADVIAFFETVNPAISNLARTVQGGNLVAGLEEAREEFVTGWIDAARQVAESARDTFRNLADSLQDYGSSLLTGQYSTLSPEQQFLAAQTRYRDLYALANDNDPTDAASLRAAQALQGAMDDYLRENEEFNASTNPAVMEEVQQGISDTVTMAERQYDIANDQLSELQRIAALAEGGPADVIQALHDLGMGKFGLPEQNWGRNVEQNQSIVRLLAQNGIVYDQGFGAGKLNALRASNPEIDRILRGAGYATGTLSALPGLSWVGEKGPELVDFGGGGARVWDHLSSMQMARDWGAAANDRWAGVSEIRAPRASGGNDALLLELQALRKEVAHLRAENARDAKTQTRVAAVAGERMVAGINRTADAAQKQAAKTVMAGSKVA